MALVSDDCATLGSRRRGCPAAFPFAKNGLGWARAPRTLPQLGLASEEPDTHVPNRLPLLPQRLLQNVRLLILSGKYCECKIVCFCLAPATCPGLPGARPPPGNDSKCAGTPPPQLAGIWCWAGNDKRRWMEWRTDIWVLRTRREITPPPTECSCITAVEWVVGWVWG